MIQIVHFGSSTSRLRETRDRIQRINASTPCSLSSPEAANSLAPKIAITGDGKPLTSDQVKALSRSDVTIYVGDSTGIPEEILRSSSHVSLSALPLSHHTELLILTEALESVLCRPSV